MPDVAYHVTKWQRGFARAINVQGADHHSTVTRVRIGLQALDLGLPAGYPDYVLHQMVTVMKGGEEMKVSKRAGSYVTVRDLVDEVGRDAVRYFFLMRKADSHLQFDVDLALKRTEENPVFYVQMAHARMSGIFRVGNVDPASVTADGVDVAALSDPSEAELLKLLARFPEVVARAADALEPQRITGYLEELARAAHLWYHKCRVLGRARRGGAGAPGAGHAPRGSCWPTRWRCWGCRRRTGCNEVTAMSLLVVGSIALDSVETPFGRTENALGGSAVYLRGGRRAAPSGAGGRGGGARLSDGRAASGSSARGLDLRGVTVADGESFRWAGKYGFDLQTRDTLETRLGVFANFKPVIPEPFRDAAYVFLGNIDPELQLQVLEQVHQPKFVACDTMNYWIQGKRTALLKLLEQVDVLLVNDSEVRELSGDWHIHRAARWVLERGPKFVVVKKGEHGAVLVERDRIFYVPAFPLDDVFDPTGAGDAFAGGFMAHLARTGDLSEANLRRRDGLRLDDGLVRGGALLHRPLRGDHAGRRHGARPGAPGPRALRAGAGR